MSIAPTIPTATMGSTRRRLSTLLSLELFLGVLSVGTIAFLWEFAKPLGIPVLKNLPSISEIVRSSEGLFALKLYWMGWALSLERITAGFVLAQLLGIPVGLAMAMHRPTFETTFPVVEILRPIPPVAWIPISILFWPTRELSVIFIVFLGAFWIVLLNTTGGASNIDINYKRAALSLGSTPRDMFLRIILPATIPSIITGMAVGMGIAWEMVVSAEMVAGRTGLGYLLWQSFEDNAIAQVIICMISIGLSGYVSSQIIRLLGYYVAPWQRQH